MFNGLPSLQSLNLFSNKLKTLDPKLFRALGSLQEIDLSQNELTSIDVNQFKGLTKLNSISLQKNPWKNPDKLELAIERSVEFVSFKNDFDDNDLDSVVVLKN